MSEPREDRVLRLLDALEAEEPISDPELTALLNALDEDATPVPSERMRARFYRELAHWERRATKPSSLSRLRARIVEIWPRRPLQQFALAAATLLVGLLAGWLTADVARHRDVDELRAELQETRESFALALLDSRSASERLQAVTLARSEAQSERVLESLLAVLEGDPSENVRLAALDVLASRADRPAVESGLAQALERQSSPMLQLAVGAVLAETSGSAARPALEQLLERPDLDPLVRDRIEALRGESSL